MAEVSGVPARTALIVIDMQRGFFEEPTLARQQAGLVAAVDELLAEGGDTP